MRSTTKSIKIPSVLLDAMEKRVEENNFPSLNSYLIALIRRDLFFRDNLLAPAIVANLPLESQDVVDDFVAITDRRVAQGRTSALSIQSLFIHLLTRSAPPEEIRKQLQDAVEQLADSIEAGEEKG